jgi:hypothetical protein
MWYYSAEEATMTPEFIAILAVGFPLYGIFLMGFQLVLKRLDRIEDRLGHVGGRVDCVEGRIDRVEERLGGQIGQLSARVGDMEQRQSRIEGLLEGIRDSLFDRSRG